MSPLLNLLQQYLTLLIPPRPPPRRVSPWRGDAILLAGAVTIALLVVSVITKFVEAKLPK